VPLRLPTQTIPSVSLHEEHETRVIAMRVTSKLL
jgi:hypothetical protein